MSKELTFSDNARDKMKAGLDKVAAAVKCTLGPKGRNVVIKNKFGKPVITKDGVSVANGIDVLADPTEDTGAQLCKQVASKTNTDAGDGTTTATILAQAIVDAGLKYLKRNVSPIEIKKGIDQAVDAVKAHIDSTTTPITLADKDLVEFIATVSGNDPEVGKMVADAYIAAGENGVVTFDTSQQTETSLKIEEGMQFDRGYISPYFVPNFGHDPKAKEVVLDKPVILLWEKRIANAQEFVPFLEKIAHMNRPCLVIADDIEGEALATAVLNTMRNVVTVCCIKTPRFGEQKKNMMRDLAMLTGGTFFEEVMGAQLDKLNDSSVFGEAKKIVVTADSTTIIGGNCDKEKLTEYINNLKTQAQESDSKYDKEKLNERIAKLSGCIAVIQIGATTETEMAEKKYRYEDAVSATKAALEQGIVVGGGVALLNSINAIENLKVDGDAGLGVAIIKEALSLPARTIAENAGMSGEYVISHLNDLRKSDDNADKLGFNARTGQFENLFAAGIVDPAKVTKSALENAASIAGLFLTTECLLTDAKEDEKAPQPNYGM